MTAPEVSTASSKRGPNVVVRADRYWFRVLLATVAALTLTAAWVLGGRQLQLEVPVARTVALLVLLQLLLLPSPSGDTSYSLRGIVAVVGWLLTWGTLLLIGF